MTLGDKIKSARVAKGLTQSALAALVHVEPATVSRWESAKMGVAAEHIPVIARVLDRPASWFTEDGPDLNSVVARLDQLERRAAPKELSADELKLINFFRGTDDGGRDRLLDLGKREHNRHESLLRARK